MLQVQMVIKNEEKKNLFNVALLTLKPPPFENYIHNTNTPFPS